MTTNPAGYSRAARIATVVAAIAGAASQDACTCCGENPARRDTGLCGVCIGNRCPRCVFGPPEYCDCCGHRYAGDHVPGQPCPCGPREAWEGS